MAGMAWLATTPRSSPRLLRTGHRRTSHGAALFLVHPQPLAVKLSNSPAGSSCSGARARPVVGAMDVSKDAEREAVSTS